MNVPGVLNAHPVGGAIHLEPCAAGGPVRAADNLQRESLRSHVPVVQDDRIGRRYRIDPGINIDPVPPADRQVFQQRLQAVQRRFPIGPADHPRIPPRAGSRAIDIVVRRSGIIDIVLVGFGLDRHGAIRFVEHVGGVLHDHPPIHGYRQRHVAHVPFINPLPNGKVGGDGIPIPEVRRIFQFHQFVAVQPAIQPIQQRIPGHGIRTVVVRGHPHPGRIGLRHGGLRGVAIGPDIDPPAVGRRLVGHTPRRVSRIHQRRQLAIRHPSRGREAPLGAAGMEVALHVISEQGRQGNTMGFRRYRRAPAGHVVIKIAAAGQGHLLRKQGTIVPEGIQVVIPSESIFCAGALAKPVDASVGAARIQRAVGDRQGAQIDRHRDFMIPDRAVFQPHRRVGQHQRHPARRAGVFPQHRVAEANVLAFRQLHPHRLVVFNADPLEFAPDALVHHHPDAGVPDRQVPQPDILGIFKGKHTQIPAG